VRAVECAVAIQKVMTERNANVPKERQMLLRIGINLGDIIHDADKTYGDGINVAARLEPLAEPGGIRISANVRDAIFGKLGLPLRDVGEKTLKNIDRPVHVFEIPAAGEPRAPRLARRRVAPVSPPGPGARARSPSSAVGRPDEAAAVVADWRKTGPYSIATASCWQIKEPMKSIYLGDLRKAGLPEK
jgi:hypothetical protein